MAEIRSLTRKLNYDKNGGVPWSDLNQDVLSLVMMKLGVIDFVSFSGVCKSWRSLALPNRKLFMESRPPMAMWLSTESNEKKWYLKDFEGRIFKTILPQSAGRRCVGVTCGYLILFGRETCDFWLVNPITRHQLHFPGVPCSLRHRHYSIIRAILVFSPSVSEWLFVITERLLNQIWFSVAGKGVWNHVQLSTTSSIYDLHAFKGKRYTLVADYLTFEKQQLYEMRFGTEPKLMLLKTKNFPKIEYYPECVSSDETLHVLTYFSGDVYKIHKLDCGEFKWVYCENTNEEYAFFKNDINYKTTTVKSELWAGTDKSQKGRANVAYMWYFPHECLNVNLIDA